MNTLYVVRHGKTNWNKMGAVQGITDVELNEDGINDAIKLSKTINLDEIDVCISSPLKRAKKTAEIITNNKIDVICDDLLIERCFGDYEASKASYDFLAKCWDYKLNYSSNDVEPIRDCLNRAKVFLDKIKREYPDKNILIVSHGAFIKAIHFNIVGYDENTDFLSFKPQNTTLYKYILK